MSRFQRKITRLRPENAKLGANYERIPVSSAHNVVALFQYAIRELNRISFLLKKLYGLSLIVFKKLKPMFKQLFPDQKNLFSDVESSFFLRFSTDVGEGAIAHILP